MMPYLTFNFYPTVMVEKNDNAFCDHSAFAFNFGSIDQVAVGHGLKMTQTMITVYSILLFSVDFKEKPMFTRVKQGSNSPQVDVAQGHVFLSVGRCVEVADDLPSLSFGIASVVFHSSRNHRGELGRLAVFGLPVA